MLTKRIYDLNVCIFTNHFANSKRRGNIHWIGFELARMGHGVTFLTTGLSWLTYWKSDTRREYLGAGNKNRIEQVAPQLRQIALFAPFHPVNLRRAFANRLLEGLWSLYPHFALGRSARKLLCEADMVIFESGLPVLLIERARRFSSRAKFVYRVSDDVTSLGCHPIVEKVDRKISHRVDAVSVQSKEYASRYSGARSLRVHPPSIATDLFSERNASPYPLDGRRRFLSIGSSFFDEELITAVASQFPDDEVVVIGNVSIKKSLPNIRLLGEIPFLRIVAYIQHADIGLAPYDSARIHPGLVESSHKLTQFRYLAKPVITSSALCRPNICGLFGYEKSNPESVRRAAEQAILAIGTLAPVEPVVSWRRIAEDICSSVGLSSDIFDKPVDYS